MSSMLLRILEKKNKTSKIKHTKKGAKIAFLWLLLAKIY